MPKTKRDPLLSEFGDPITQDNMHIDTSLIGRGNRAHLDAVQRAMQQAVIQANPAKPSSPFDLTQTIPSQTNPVSLAGGMPAGGPPLAGFQLGGTRNQPSQGAVPQQQGNSSGGIGGFFKHLGEAMAAGGRGITIAELHGIRARNRLMQGQAQLQQFEVQEKLRDQKAIQNVPQFQKAKLPILEKFLGKREAEKKKIDPAYTMNEGDIMATMVDVNKASPGTFAPVDFDTMFRTKQGKLMTLGLRGVPFETGIEIIQHQTQLNQEHQNKVREQIKLNTIAEAKQLLGSNEHGPLRSKLVLKPEAIPLIEGLGRNPRTILAELTAGHVSDVDPEMMARANTGRPVEGDPRVRTGLPVPGDAKIHSDNFATMQALTDRMQGKVKTEAQDPVYTGTQANALMRQRHGTLLNKPEEFTFYPPGQTVPSKQFEKDSEEFGQNLRRFHTAETQQTLQSQRAETQVQENQKNRELKQQLADQKNTSIHDLVDTKGKLALELQQRAQTHQLKRDQNKFTQQDLRDQFKAESQLEAQRERLQTQAGITFTKEGMRQAIQKGDANETLKFAMEANRAKIGTVRGVLGNALKMNPGLAMPLLERLTQGDVGSDTIAAVRGAVSDYLASEQTMAVEDRARNIMAKSITDSSKENELKIIKRQLLNSGSTPDSPDVALLDSLLATYERKGGGVTVINNPDGTQGTTLDEVMKRKTITQLQDSNEVVRVATRLLELSKDAPLGGLHEVWAQFKNYVADTRFNYETDDNLEPDVVDTLFNPKLAPAILIRNELQYAIARSREPGARLAVADIEKVNIKGGLTQGGLDVKEAAKEAMSMAQRRAMEASDLLRFGQMSLVPTPSDMDMAVEALAAQPGIRQRSDKDLLNDIHRFFLSSSTPVYIGQSTAAEIRGRIKKRLKP